MSSNSEKPVGEIDFFHKRDDSRCEEEDDNGSVGEREERNDGSGSPRSSEGSGMVAPVGGDGADDVDEGEDGVAEDQIER